MVKTNQELFEYAVKMRQMGDSYRAMLNYLENNTDNEETVKEIISLVDKLEKEKKFKIPEKTNKGASLTAIILGSILIIAGVVLIVVLWKRGFVAGLPAILIIIGFYAFSGKI